MELTSLKGLVLKDQSTGQESVVADVFTNRYRTDEPEFFKFYVTDIAGLMNVKGSDFRVLLNLLKYMDYGNIIDLNPRIRSLICETVGFDKTTSLNSTISRLTKTGLIIPISRGSYLANPDFFAKGAWKDIKKIRVTMEYSNDGKRIESKFITGSREADDFKNCESAFDNAKTTQGND